MRNLGVCSFWFILEVDTSVVETSPQLEESLLSTVNVAPELNCRAPVWYLRRNYFLGDDISPPHRSACVDGWEHSQRSGWFSLFHPVTFSLSQSLILTSPYTEVIQESPDDILYQCHLFMSAPCGFTSLSFEKASRGDQAGLRLAIQLRFHWIPHPSAFPSRVLDYSTVWEYYIVWAMTQKDIVWAFPKLISFNFS